MQRPVEVEGQEIGDVDQRRDRPEPDRLEPVAAAIPGSARSSAPRMWRPRNSGQAFRSSMRDARSAMRSCPGPGVVSSGFSVPTPAAARSRAMPRTPRQSARFGVTLMSMTGSSSPAQLDIARADRRVRRQLDDAVVIVAERQLVAPSISMPFEATPRIALSFSSAPVRGMVDAGRREHALHPGARVGRAAHDLDLRRCRYRRRRRAAGRHWDAARPRRRARR